jgi:hypothetical protein
LIRAQQGNSFRKHPNALMLIVDQGTALGGFVR